jgi:RNA 2',3'-cyclic 3'-phosphodiesterase
VVERRSRKAEVLGSNPRRGFIMIKRTFIAIEISKEFFDDFITIQNKFKSILKKTDVKSFHITLCFLGEINNIEQIKEELKKIKKDKFKITLKDTGFFGKPPKVLWIGIESVELKELSKKIHNVLKIKSEHDYNPHLTLARIKECTDNKAFKDSLLSIKYDKEFLAEEFILFSSILMPNGPKYQIIEKYKLI